MSINKSCPVVFEQVDKNILKINALIIFSFLLWFVISYNPVFLFLITVDFIIRVFFGLKYSPICFFIKRGLRLSGVQPHLTNAGPKIFAARVGLMFSTLALIFYFSGFPILTIGISLVFLTAVGMDVFFNICVACNLYPYFYKYFGR